MKRGWIGFLILVISAVFSWTAHAQPKIEFEERVFDFGITYPDDTLVHDFKFWNKGNETLILKNVTTTCGCAAAILSATSILPGSSGILSVTMVTVTPRKKKESATLDTNDPAMPKITVDVETVVRNLWAFSPKESFIFTEIPFGGSQSMQITMRNLDKEPFKILATKVLEPELSVQLGDPVDEGVPITVTVNAGKEKKLINDQVQIRTDNPKQPVVQIPVFARIVGFVRFDRQRVFFGSMNQGETKVMEISAVGNDPTHQTPLEMSEISSDPAMVSGQVLGKRGDGALRIQLTFKAPDKPGYHTGMISFHTNMDREKVTTLPYSALVRAQ